MFNTWGHTVCFDLVIFHFNDCTKYWMLDGMNSIFGTGNAKCSSLVHLCDQQQWLPGSASKCSWLCHSCYYRGWCRKVSCCNTITALMVKLIVLSILLSVIHYCIDWLDYC